MFGRHRVTIWTAMSLLGLLLACYGNSFRCAWHYDDSHNIVRNERIHMTEWRWEQLVRAFNGGPTRQVIARPLAHLSFAINYKLGRLDVFGYHLVNFAIHWCAGLVLFLLIRGTLLLPVFKGEYRARATLIAWLAAVLWACHPIQVTAVTYIVQRMTSMAGLFYLTAMYAYLIGRRSQRGRRRWAAFGLCAASGVAALLTKENAVLLVYSLLLYDLLFFQGIDAGSVRRTLFIGSIVTIVLAGLSLPFLDPQNIFSPYTNRPFTMAERLLTQPRVLFIYLSLLAVPMTGRMSILHDVAVSRSLVDPWTTLPAIIGVVSCIVFFWGLSHKHPLMAFCGLFFFLSHAVESSFLNLELIYEHRNYVPSMFIFLPPAIAAVRVSERFYYRFAMQAAISLVLAFWIGANVHTTWSYNLTFRTCYTLWVHALSVYPDLSLPYISLGKALWHAGERDAASRLISKGISVDNFKNLEQKGVAYYNLGRYAAEEKGDLERALRYFQAAARFSNNNPAIWEELVRTKMQLGRFQAAAEDIRHALERWPSDLGLMRLKAVNDLKIGAYEDARVVSELILARTAKLDKIAMMANAESYRMLARPQKALAVWHRLLEADPENMAALMALTELTLERSKKSDVGGYVKRLLRLDGVKELRTGAGVRVKDGNMIPYVPDMTVIREAINRYDG